MSKLRCAVIGVGYLGKFHAEKYKLLDNVELVGVCDVDKVRCSAIADELQTKAFFDYKELFGKVDAISIATTTAKHYIIAKECLENNIHVLIEKPMTETVKEANELIHIAKINKLKLQVGHLERFNAARLALTPYIDKPLFIDSQRLAPFTPRGADVNVVLDLMIHDIDLIQNIVQSPIINIDAQGAPVLSSAIDIASARITFENQCVANVIASRVSFKTERKTRIFQQTSYISVDYHKKQFAIFKKGDGEMFDGVANINQQEFVFENSDALLAEIKAFVEAIQNDTTPLVTGEDGCAAIETAAKITQLIEKKIQYLHEQTL